MNALAKRLGVWMFILYGLVCLIRLAHKGCLLPIHP